MIDCDGGIGRSKLQVYSILPGVHSCEIEAILVWTSTKPQQRVVISNFLNEVERD